MSRNGERGGKGRAPSVLQGSSGERRGGHLFFLRGPCPSLFSIKYRNCNFYLSYTLILLFFFTVRNGNKPPNEAK